uniref:Uncharacterized protein n=1 Tax=Ditylenchus dipsaci TaxID=166011 RepID=A0A915DEQ1_9BILA
MLGIAGLLSLILAAFASYNCYFNSAGLYAQSALKKQISNNDGIHLTCMEKSIRLMRYCVKKYSGCGL